jgi:hypothetical protein
MLHFNKSLLYHFIYICQNIFLLFHFMQHASAASWECLEQGSNGIKANSRLSGVMGERSWITEDYSKSKSSQNMK